MNSETFSTMDSIFSPMMDVQSPPVIEKICIVSTTENYLDIVCAAEKFKLPVIFRSVWSDNMYDENMLFVLEEFEGTIFDKLKRKKAILGPTALSQINVLPMKPMPPLFCLILYKKKICISGFEPFVASHLKRLINYMGGSVRPEVRQDIAYLVASSGRDPQYKKAVSLGIPVLEQQWVMELWSHRHDDTFKVDSTGQKFKLNPFVGFHLVFSGFTDQEKLELDVMSKRNGATVGSSFQEATHVIVRNDPASIAAVKADCPQPRVAVVLEEWFWKSLEAGYPHLEENYSCINAEKLQKMSFRRRQQCLELYETEKSYVAVLHVTLSLFKVPLEEAHLNGTPLITPTDIEIIFGKLTPIYDVHKAILDDLRPLVENWKDDNCVGQVFVKHNVCLKKVYPPFVNFQEASRKKIEECEASNAKFLAFLRRVEADPTCRRQELKDLLSWPVQRIGRLILLLQGIQKDTLPGNPDYPTLGLAIKALEECGKEVNEDKRKMEIYISTLDAYNDIENGPTELLQNRRYLVEKVMVQEVLENGKISDHKIVMFLFRGYLELCKRKKHQGLTPTISRSGGAVVVPKKYKHLLLYPLEWISHVIYIVNPPEHSNKFALTFQPTGGKYWRTIYQLTEKHKSLEKILDSFASVIAKCKLQKMSQVKRYMTYPNVLDYFKSYNVEEPSPSCMGTPPPSPGGESLNLDTTPRKSFLRRAVSTILTPFGGNSGNLMPESRAGSSTSINSLPSISIGSGETPKVKKKLKSNSFGSRALFWNR